MDSGNSGSMQSSSGDDDEYDSRPESIPCFLNNPPPPQFGASDSNPEPSLLSHFQNHHSGFFDISSNNYFQALSQSQSQSQSQPNSNPNFLLNLDTVGSRTQRSEPNCTGLGAPSSTPTLSMLLASQGPGPGSERGSVLGPGPSVIQLRPVNTSISTSTSTGRNSKKRTRASRRAPTTVLTTDTSNFRAMVQEFTGIPAPPFSGSSYSRRFDLFGTGSAMTMRSGSMDTLGPLYPLRPSPQKSPFLSSSHTNNNNMIESPNAAATPSDNNFLSSSSNYQQPPPSDHPKHRHVQLNMQNHPVTPHLPLFQIQSPHHSMNPVPPQGSLSMASLQELDHRGRHELFRASSRGEAGVDSWICPSD